MYGASALPMISSKPWFSMTITATWLKAPGLADGLAPGLAVDGDSPEAEAVAGGGEEPGAPVFPPVEHAPRAPARAVTTTRQTRRLRLGAVFPQVLDVEGPERLRDLALPGVHDVVDESRGLQDVDLGILE